MKNGGKRPGAGRKPKAIELRQAETLNALLEQGWPEAERIELIKKLSGMALQGDTKAAALLLAYGYGRPTERVELTGKDSAPVQIQVVEVRGPDA